MTILGTRAPRTTVDPARVGVRTLGGLRAPLAVVARLAEAERVLPAGLHLLVLELPGSSGAPTVDVTLVDDAGDPVWMGAMPIVTGGTGSGTGLPAAQDHETCVRLRALATAMRSAGFVQRTAAWFRWEL